MDNELIAGDYAKLKPNKQANPTNRYLDTIDGWLVSYTERKYHLKWYSIFIIGIVLAIEYSYSYRCYYYHDYYIVIIILCYRTISLL